jgi:hypothetical protein
VDWVSSADTDSLASVARNAQGGPRVHAVFKAKAACVRKPNSSSSGVTTKDPSAPRAYAARKATSFHRIEMRFFVSKRPMAVNLRPGESSAVNMLEAHKHA